MNDPTWGIKTEFAAPNERMVLKVDGEGMLLSWVCWLISSNINAQSSINKISLKIIFLKFHSNLTGYEFIHIDDAIWPDHTELMYTS